LDIEGGVVTSASGDVDVPALLASKDPCFVQCSKEELLCQ